MGAQNEELTNVTAETTAPTMPVQKTGVGAMVDTKTAPVDPKESTTEQAPSLSPEVQAEIDRRLQSVKDEYEKVHIAALKRKYDTKLAERERELKALRDQQLAQIRAQMDEDPAGAGQQLLSQMEQMQAQQQAQEAERSWQQWVAGEYERLGFSTNDDATAGEMVQQTEQILNRLRQGASPTDIAVSFQRELSERALERERKEAATVKKQLEDMQKNLPELVKQELAQLRAGGGGPEITGQGGNAATDTRTASQKIRDGIRKGREAVPINK